MEIKLNVNKKLLPGKIAFFGMMSAGLWTYPFMILFFKQMGLTTTECSIIYGSLPIFNGFFKLFIGAVADKLQRHKEMMLLFALISAFLMNCLLLIPHVEVKYPPKPDWNGTLYYRCSKYGQTNVLPIECTVHNASQLHPVLDKSDIGEDEWYKIKNNELGSLSDCTEKLNSSFFVEDGCLEGNTTDSININHEMSEKGSFLCQLDCTKYPTEYLNPSEPEKEMFGKTFWMVLCLYFVAFNIMASIWVLLYGMNYAILGEKRNNFGKQRMWGTVGALTTSIISAIAMNKYGSATPDITYTPCFIGFGIWIVITGITAMFFKLPYMARNPTMAKDMYLLLKQPQIFLLFIVLFIMGFLWGAVETFLFVFLRSLNASSWALGTCLFVRYLGEIPSLYYSGRIIKRIGHVKCLYIVLLAYSIRYLGTSLIPNPWWEIPFSCIKSIVFSIGFTAVSVYSSAITPPSMHATLQAMVQTVHFGVGRGIGILAFGPMLDAIGARWSFRIGSIIAFVTFIFYIIAQQFVPPVKFVTHDEEKDVEVKEPLHEENGDVKKPVQEEDVETKQEHESLGDKLSKTDDDPRVEKQEKGKPCALEHKNGAISNGIGKV